MKDSLQKGPNSIEVNVKKKIVIGIILFIDFYKYLRIID